MEISESQFDEFENNKRRRQLLPWWIKFFCWLFMLFGLLAILCLILGFFGFSPSLAFYGFKTNQPLSLIGLLIVSIAILKGYTAYSLWFEKDFAVKLSKIDAVIGIVTCLITMFILPFLVGFDKIVFRLEIIFLIIFLVKINKIEKDWKKVSI
tara:strand:+ start:273 stop:731 length:459 start_codon:yes stop_codon:yes gene_type:complete